MKPSEIYIVTGGGDCAGLKAFAEGVFLQAQYYDIDVYGYLQGWWGPLNNRTVKLTAENVDLERLVAGTLVGTSRTNITKKDEDMETTTSNLSGKVIIGAGGDDTLGVLAALQEKYPGRIKAIGVPKTMDGNLSAYSLGLDWAIQNIMDDMKRFWTTIQSHGRIIVVEVFGRREGHTALNAGIAGGADVILLPELYGENKCFDKQTLGITAKALKDRYIQRAKNSLSGAGYAMVIVSEGIKISPEFLKEELGIEIGETETDDFGNVVLKEARSGYYIAKLLQKRLEKDEEILRYVPKLDVRDAVLAHQVRGGTAGWYDAKKGIDLGSAAVDLAVQGKYGLAVVDVLPDGTIHTIPLRDVLKRRAVDLGILPKYEALGVNFGREPVKYTPNIQPHQASGQEVTKRV